ncbi:hypothetical protein STEG23_024656, partial [Scotinomys teguina]
PLWFLLAYLPSYLVNLYSTFSFFEVVFGSILGLWVIQPVVPDAKGSVTGKRLYTLVNEILADRYKFLSLTAASFPNLFAEGQRTLQDNTQNLFSLLPKGLGRYTVNSAYGDTIVMPCRLDVPQNLMFGKWKY